ncbi:MAG TPA: DUF3524 domain-containing protein [Tepidisphaeraceae bacterium]|nr:DUF3524 domain-containing protein [Tepidisphaeraceae bacterium]
MPKQLDILALEPFFGGIRRNMLETIIRCSRHRWTLLKLPPRRIERRLAAAAHWFSEQLSRHWVGHVDLLFTSEALNLADLYRLTPNLARKPAVVYFHSNELPEPGVTSVNPALDYANLNTAAAATEIWFNSKFHVRMFLAGVNALVTANTEFAAQNPMPALTVKIRHMPPPVDLSIARELTAQQPPPVRGKRTVFVETRDANIDLLNAGLGILQRRGEKVQLITVGPVEHLTTEVPRQTLPENDVVGQSRAILESTIFASTKIAATFDEHAVRALALGCRTVMPRTGVYPELLPKAMHGSCLYDIGADSLASRLQDALYGPANVPGAQDELERSLHTFDLITICKLIDERLSELSEAHTTSRIARAEKIAAKDAAANKAAPAPRPDGKNLQPPRAPRPG